MITLTPVEARILGCLVEKERTTPDQYPLSMNSLITACNQKTSRHPVMELDETEVSNCIYDLREKSLVWQRASAGSRVAKYTHGLEEQLGLSDAALSLLAVLMLRGPQTAAELKAHTQRLCSFSSVPEVDEVMEQLIRNQNGAMAVRLPRQPGQKEERYAHLLCGEPDTSVPDIPARAPRSTSPAVDPEQIGRLENEIAELKSQMEDLQQQFDTFRSQFD